MKWNDIKLKYNDHFIIIFTIINNEMDISFYFYIWYNKILKKWNGKKLINYNNSFITKIIKYLYKNNTNV